MINHNHPNTFGPILWDEYGEDAAECNTMEEQKYFCKRIRRRQKTLRCHTCSEDFGKIIEANPPEDYIWVRTTHGQEYGMLFWLWKVHNLVNQKLGKPMFEWEMCYTRFTTEMVVPCMKENCGSEHNTVVENKNEIKNNITLQQRNPIRIIPRRS